jgi:hypothetical protein
VERVSGEPFADYIHAHIFEPLGMTHSTFVQPLPEGAPGIMSGGYKNGADGEAGFFEVIPAAPAGSLTTTSGDMALFMNAHLNNGAGLLRPETAQQMHETVDQQFSEVNSMLLGFYQENYAGQRIIAHGGDTTFFHSNLSLLMDQNVGVYISLNSAAAARLSRRCCAGNSWSNSSIATSRAPARVQSRSRCRRRNSMARLSSAIGKAPAARKRARFWWRISSVKRRSRCCRMATWLVRDCRK